jgi:hypothetical protein
VTPTRLIGVYGGPTVVVRYANGDETQYISAMFACNVQSGELRADSDEVHIAQYWARDEALRLPLSPWLADVLPRLYDEESTAWFEPASWRPE